MSGMKEKKKVQTENQERIKTPVSEMVRKFKKQKNAVIALCFIIFLIFRGRLICDVTFDTSPFLINPRQLHIQRRFFHACACMTYPLPHF